MNNLRSERSLIAWMLYASVLLSLFACGIHHGQMSGLALSGLGSGYCSHNGEAGSGFDSSGSEQTQHTAAQFSCPLCSSFSIAFAVNSSSWGLDVVPHGSISPIIVRTWAQPPPRYLWPSLNPRASPIASLVV